MTSALRGNGSVLRRPSDALLQVAAGTVLIVLALGITLSGPAADPVRAGGVVALLAVAAWMLMSRRYELTLAVLMLYLGLLDGYLKLRLNTEAATLGRDLLLYSIAAGALGYATVHRRRLTLPPLSGWVIAWCIVVGVQLSNPSNGTLFYSLSAVRQHLEFVPLFFLGYIAIRSKRRLVGFFTLLVAVAALNGVVGLIQFNLTPDQLASWGPGYAQRIEGTGDVSGRYFVDKEGTSRTRPFGLGADFGFAGIVALLAAPAALALLSLTRHPLFRLTVLLMLGGVVLGVATSQARVAVLGSIVAVLAFALLALSARTSSRSLTAMGVTGVIGFVAVTALISDSDSGAFDRYSSISPGQAVATTIDYRSSTLARIPDYMVEIPFGAGIGYVGPATVRPGRPTPYRVLDAESEPTFLLIEAGIAGLVVILGLFVKLFALSLHRIRLIEDPELRVLLAGVAAPVFAIFVTGIVGISTATTPSAPYLWFTAGILAYWLADIRAAGAHSPVRGITTGGRATHASPRGA